MPTPGPPHTRQLRPEEGRGLGTERAPAGLESSSSLCDLQSRLSPGLYCGSADLPLNQWAPWEAPQPPAASGTTPGWLVTHGGLERSPTPCNSVPDPRTRAFGPRAGCSGCSQYLEAPKVIHPVRPLPAGVCIQAPPRPPLRAGVPTPGSNT